MKITQEQLKNTTEFKTLPTVKSTDVEWIKWVDLVLKKYGASLGKQVFLAAWMKRGSNLANTIAFRKHIKDEYNLEIDESVWNKIADFGGGVADTFGKIFKVGKVMMYVVGGVIVLAVGGVVYNAVKTGTSPLKMLKK